MLITIGQRMDNQYPEYPLIPEQSGDEDRKLNPYAPV
jgi:hypothetical protein